MKQLDQVQNQSKKPLQLFQKYKFLLLVAGVGILLLLLPERGSQSVSKAASGDQQSAAFSLEEAEQKMERVLSEVDGAGQVHVILTLKNDGERFFLQDETTSQKSNTEGGTDRSAERETVIVSRGSGLQEAVVTGQDYPCYQGALIVCEGGGNASVCLELTRATSALTGLGSDQITVLKMKSE